MNHIKNARKPEDGYVEKLSQSKRSDLGPITKECAAL